MIGRAILRIFLSFFALWLSGCLNVSLTPESPEALSITSEDSFCIVDPVEIEGDTKVMFVVDVSGSNASTDPYGLKRADNIDNFVDGLSQQEGYQYGIILFDDSPVALINEEGDSNRAIFTKDLNEVKSASDEIRQNPYRGNTNYKPALNMVKQAIEDDVLKYPNESSGYVIFFISDGEPQDGNTNSQVSSLINTKGRPIYLSSAYYGRGSEDAIQRLEDMASAGRGHFVNFEDDESWDFDQLIVTGDVIPWSLKEFLVYNLNAGFCLDGKIDVDSDVDGMCDRDEIAMNNLYAEELSQEGKSFDPANRFSFGDGYGDFFHWLRFRYPGKSLTPCHDRSDQDFDLLTKCEEDELENRSSKDSRMTKGNPEVFDTDRDGILDGVETFVYFASQSTGRTTRYTAALDSENLKDNPDGEESVLVQIKDHRNPWFKDSDVIAYDTSLTPIDDLSRECYVFEQTVLPMYETLTVKAGHTLAGLEHEAKENAVLVYYIQVLQPDPGNIGILKYSVQKLGRDPFIGLKVGGETFRQYTPPPQEE